jgi:hypothetical protein
LGFWGLGKQGRGCGRWAWQVEVVHAPAGSVPICPGAAVPGVWFVRWFAARRRRSGSGSGCGNVVVGG